MNVVGLACRSDFLRRRNIEGGALPWLVLLDTAYGLNRSAVESDLERQCCGSEGLAGRVLVL